jgi:hypothetical protein
MKWISVKDGLPEECGYCLCYDINMPGSLPILCFYDDEQEEIPMFKLAFSLLPVRLNPTHWMPLPLPPKEQT